MLRLGRQSGRYRRLLRAPLGSVTAVAYRGTRAVSPLKMSDKLDKKNSQPRAQFFGETSWSSPHDYVGRNSFAHDHAHLWTLLEACLDTGNLSRAQSILVGLSEVATVQDLTLAANVFLKRLADYNKDYRPIQEAIRNLEKRVRQFTPNAVTHAIVLKSIHKSGDTSQLKNFVGRHITEMPEILSKIEVLGLATVKDIVQNKIPQNLQVVLENSKENDGEDADDSIDLNAVIPSVKKDVQEVRAIDTVGLKAIRHALLGLTMNDNSLARLQPLLQDKDVDSDNFVDFFELSKKVPEEKREEFEAILDEINEQRQKLVETRGLEGSKEKWKQQFERMRSRGAMQRSGAALPKKHELDVMLYQWNDAFDQLVNEEYKRIEEIVKYADASTIPSHLQGPTLKDRLEYGPYLRLVKKESLGPIVIMEMLRSINSGGISDGMRTTRLLINIGNAVEREYNLHRASEREKKALEGLTLSPELHKSRPEALVDLRKAINDSDEAEIQNSVSWPLFIRTKIATLLVSYVLNTAKVTVTGKDPKTGEPVQGRAPAFYHSYQYRLGNKVGCIKAHTQVTKHLSSEQLSTTIMPQQLPMLVEPRPWTAWNKGGYFYTQHKIIKTKGESREQLAYIRAASERGDLQPVFDALNVLSKTSWTINKRILETVLQVWNTGEKFLAIPKQVDPEPKYPPEPPRNADPAVRREWMMKCKEINNATSAEYSQRCDMNYKLEIARALIGERFYFPHNLDFRGRAYAISPNLNHLGNDMTRALLMFWKGKELGPRGLRWLKIHLANLFGLGKISFDDRVQFVDDHMAKLEDSATNPLGGQGWWKEADDPWQALACIYEIHEALKLDDPSKYRSHLPVHQDGSCNGLQHYAALGGDIEGASQVNLVPSDKPQDIYSKVLDIVKIKVAEDAQQGNDAANRLLPVLSRKVVKQTVMTYVYGVTFVGARNQISNRLKDLDYDKENRFSDASYLANKVLGSIRELFTSAHQIQEWLYENATCISHAVRVDSDVIEWYKSMSHSSLRKKLGRNGQFLSSVVWTTPLGLPVVQPYRSEQKKQVYTQLQSVYLRDPYAIRGVNSRRQKAAFPPNFVHSLDATHMLKSAVECGKAGIVFAAVHDSYWTHACDIDTMNAVLRDSFVDLHSFDLIQALKDEFKVRYEGLLQVIAIPKNSDLAKEITHARETWALQKFGKARKIDMFEEIQMEHERREAIACGFPDVHETSSSIIQRTDPKVLERLKSEVADMKKKRAAKKTVTFKSSYKAGYGADRFDELEKMMDEQEGSVPVEPTVEDVTEETDAVSDVATTEDDDFDATRPPSRQVLYALAPIQISEIPQKGDLAIEEVRNSQYFFC